MSLANADTGWIFWRLPRKRGPQQPLPSLGNGQHVQITQKFKDEAQIPFGEIQLQRGTVKLFISNQHNTLKKKKKELYTIPFSPYPFSGHYSLTRNRHYVISLQKALYQRGSHLPFPAQQYKSSIWREVLFIGPGTGSLPRCWLKKKIKNKKYLFCVKKKKQKKLRYLVR